MMARRCAEPTCDDAWRAAGDVPRHGETSLIAGIDDTRPYGSVEDVDWKAQRRVRVFISSLILSQHHVGVPSLLSFHEGRKRRSVQVVHWQGKYYLHNGHHRTIYAILNGRPWVWARVVDVD